MPFASGSNLSNTARICASDSACNEDDPFNTGWKACDSVQSHVWRQGRYNQAYPREVLGLSLVIFHPTFHAKSPKPIFSDFNGFPPFSRRLSLDSQSISTDFLSFFQSVSISFKQFESVSISLTRSKTQECIDNT